MDSQVLAAPLRVTPRRRIALIALAAAVAGAAIAALLVRGGDDGRPAATELRGPGFTIAYPAGWRPVPAADLPDGATALLRRTDGTGAVVVRRKARPRDGSLRALSRDLGRGLERRFPDFSFVSARVVRTRAGNAFLYTFARTRRNTAHSIALVRVGRAHYTLDAVAAAGDARAAREVGAVVRSFGP